jgi:arginyl-tRNA synthetase
MSTYHCPQCGEETDTLHEGYCEACCSANQSALDTHNAQFDIWNQMTELQRDLAIRNAIEK